MELKMISDEIYAVSKRLQKSADAIYKLGNEKAVSERDYRKALMMEILKLRSDGMPATLILDVARGNVSDLMFERDAAEARFKSAIESLEALKSQLSALQSLLKHLESIG